MLLPFASAKKRNKLTIIFQKKVHKTFGVTEKSRTFVTQSSNNIFKQYNQMNNYSISISDNKYKLPVETIYNNMNEKGLYLGANVSDSYGDLGSIMQVFDNNTVRLSSNGVCDIDSITLATKKQEKLILKDRVRNFANFQVTRFKNGVPYFTFFTMSNFIYMYIVPNEYIEITMLGTLVFKIEEGEIFDQENFVKIFG